MTIFSFFFTEGRIFFMLSQVQCEVSVSFFPEKKYKVPKWVQKTPPSSKHHANVHTVTTGRFSWWPFSWVTPQEPINRDSLQFDKIYDSELVHVIFIVSKKESQAYSTCAFYIWNKLIIIWLLLWLCFLTGFGFSGRRWIIAWQTLAYATQKSASTFLFVFKKHFAAYSFLERIKSLY